MSALLALALLAGCEAPQVYPTKDRRQNEESSRIEGQVVVTSKARGNAVLFLFDAAHPPPPVGTGRPISFGLVPKEQIFGASLTDPTAGGPFTAPYVFSLVPPGDYLIRGFIDRADDFIPWYGVTNEPDVGDVGGAAVDALTRGSRIVEIGEQDDGTLSFASGVQVSFADSATLPADRPTFKVAPLLPDNSPVFDTRQPKILQLTSEPINEGAVQEAKPAFLVRWVDDNNDGVPDTVMTKAGPVPLVWPKIFIRKIAGANEKLLLDENDLDKNGVVDATGADYDHVNPVTGASIPADGRPDAVILAAAVDPTDFGAALTDMTTGKPNMNAVVPANQLKVVVNPQALDVSDPAQPGVVKGVPTGAYAIYVLQFTGQSWRVPNECMPAFAAALGLPSRDSQGFVLTVP